MSLVELMSASVQAAQAGPGSMDPGKASKSSADKDSTTCHNKSAVNFLNVDADESDVEENPFEMFDVADLDDLDKFVDGDADGASAKEGSRLRVSSAGMSGVSGSFGAASDISNGAAGGASQGQESDAPAAQAGATASGDVLESRDAEAHTPAGAGVDVARVISSPARGAVTPAGAVSSPQAYTALPATTASAAVSSGIDGSAAPPVPVPSFFDGDAANALATSQTAPAAAAGPAELLQAGAARPDALHTALTQLVRGDKPRVTEASCDVAMPRTAAADAPAPTPRGGSANASAPAASRPPPAAPPSHGNKLMAAQIPAPAHQQSVDGHCNHHKPAARVTAHPVSSATAQNTTNTAAAVPRAASVQRSSSLFSKRNTTPALNRSKQSAAGSQKRGAMFAAQPVPHGSLFGKGNAPQRDTAFVTEPPPAATQAPADGLASKRKVGDTGTQVQDRTAKKPMHTARFAAGSSAVTMPTLSMCSVPPAEDPSPRTQRKSPLPSASAAPMHSSDATAPVPVAAHARADEHMAERSASDPAAASAAASHGGTGVQTRLQGLQSLDLGEVPDRRRELAEVSEKLHQMAIDLEATMDNALAVRVDCAIANHHWAQLAQPVYFDESESVLRSAAAHLSAADKAQARSFEIARACGWLAES